MKFYNSRKIIKKCFSLLLPVFLAFCFFNNNNNNKVNSQVNKINTVSDIQNKLDYLISKLEKTNLTNIQSGAIDYEAISQEQSSRILNMELSDEIVKTFQNIDNDISEYEMMLSQESKYKQSILQSKIKQVKDKIDVNHKMRQTIIQFKEKLEEVKNNRTLLNERINKIKELTENITSLYNKYLNLEKKVDLKTREELEYIKGLAQSNHTQKNLSDYFNLYKYIFEFYKKINGDQAFNLTAADDFHISNQDFEEFRKIVDTLNQSDIVASQILYHIIINIKYLFKSL